MDSAMLSICWLERDALAILMARGMELRPPGRRCPLQAGARTTLFVPAGGRRCDRPRRGGGGHEATAVPVDAPVPGETTTCLFR